MPPLSTDRLSFALESLKLEHGTRFERFANAYLAIEIPDLRPIGGIHDEGRDAFVSNALDDPTTFVQSSITPQWKSKIRDTINKLLKNNHNVKTLIFCSPRDIQNDADTLRKELRTSSIALDIRDRQWFICVCNSNQQRQATGEQLAAHVIDPLLGRKRVIDSMSLSLPDKEERTAAAYLQIAIADTSAGENITKPIYEAYLTYALRDTDSNNQIHRSEIYRLMRQHIPSDMEDTFRSRIDAALKRLQANRRVTHTLKTDTFAISHSSRRDLEDRLASIAVETSRAKQDVIDQLKVSAVRLGVDFAYPDDALATDILAIADRFMFTRGRDAARALKNGTFTSPGTESLAEFVEGLLKKSAGSFLSLHTISQDSFLDLVPQVVEDILKTPTSSIARRLNVAADTYFTKFAISEIPDLNKAMQQLLGNASTIVDASVIVPCMAEAAAPAGARPISSLIRMAVACGVKCYTTPDVINEIEGHIRTVRAANNAVALHNGQARRTPMLLQAYRSRSSDSNLGTLEEFLDRFAGVSTPTQDIQEYLDNDLDIRSETFESIADKIDLVELEKIVEEWKRTRPERYDLDDNVFDLLVRHDAKALLTITALRDKDNNNKDNVYGHRWWWLTMDSTAFKMDQRTSKKPELGSRCMSPDYFARYLSRVSRIHQGNGVMPLAVDVAALGLVPDAILERVRNAMDGAENVPEYVRRRKIRELMNQARGSKVW